MNLTSRLRKSSVLSVMCCVLMIQSLAAPVALAAVNPPSVPPPSAPGGTRAPLPVGSAAPKSGGAPPPIVEDIVAPPSGVPDSSFGSGDATTFGLGSATTASKAWANGLASVDPSTGSARASLPFELPPARGSVQPSLSLEYDSSGGDREAGVGWGLTLPSIERRSPTGLVQPLYADPLPGTAANIDTDRFIFAGSSLVPICLVSGSSCGSVDIGGIPAFALKSSGWMFYRLQTDSGSTLRFFWSPDHMTWVVQDKHGSTSEFGVPLDGNYDTTNGVDIEPAAAVQLSQGQQLYTSPIAPAFRWNLVRQYDANAPKSSLAAPANPIVYVWNATGNRHGLSDIYDTPPLTPWPPLSAYAHHAHLAWQSYQYYTPLNTPTWRAKASAILQGVDVTSADMMNPGGRYLVRRYHLGYEATNIHTLLQSFELEGRCDSPIAETGSGTLPATNCLALPAATMTYVPPLVTPTPILYAFSGLLQNVDYSYSGRTVTDANNDGLPDLLVSSPADKCDYCLYSTHVANCCQTCGCQQQVQDLYLNGETAVSAFTHESVSVAVGTPYTDARADNLQSGAGWDALNAGGTSSVTPGIRGFPGDFIGDGSVNMLWVNANPDLGGANPCNPPALETWRTMLYKLSPPVSPSLTWQWTPSVSQYAYMVPNDLEFGWIAAGDVDGDGYVDRLTLADGWSTGIVPGSNCSGSLTNSTMGVERTLTNRDGSIRPFGYSPIQNGATTEYNGPWTGVCNDSDVSWLNAYKNYFDTLVATNYWNNQNQGNGAQPAPLPISPPVWLQDMDGDGLEDVVVYDDWETAGTPYISYYAGRGDGFFGQDECTWTQARGLVCNCANARGVTMQNTPDIRSLTNGGAPPQNYLPYFIHDITGDGLADFIQVVGTAGGTAQGAPWSLVIYTNYDGTRFNDAPITASLYGTTFDPTTSTITFADMNGSGIDDIAVITGNSFWVVSLDNGERPLLLKSIANGYGATTTLYYATTASLQTAAAAAGEPWTTHSPQSFDVVVAVETTNGLDDAKGTGQCTSHAIDHTSTFQYRDPVYDVRDRQFLGFHEVTSASLGASDQIVTVDYAIDPTPPGYSAVDNPYESIRGLPIEILRGSTNGTLSLTHNEYSVSLSAVGLDGRNSYLVYAERADEWLWDVPYAPTQPLAVQEIDAPGYPALEAQRTIYVPGGRTAPHLEQTRTLSGIANNVSNQVDLGVVSGGPIDTPIVTTLTWAQQGASGSWIWRTTDSTTAYATGGLTRESVYQYDAAGNNTDVIGVLQGTVTPNRFSQVAGMMTAPLPNGRSADGRPLLLHRDMDPAGSGNVQMDHRPGGQCIAYSYDPAFQQYRTLVTTYGGAVGNNGCGAQPIPAQYAFDAGLGKMTSSTDANGAMALRKFDGFGRLVQVFAPDPVLPYVPDSLAAVMIDYPPTTPGQPIGVHVQTLQQGTSTGPNQPPSGLYREVWQYSDALALPLATLTTADPSSGDVAPWVLSGTTDVSPEGLIIHACQADWYSGNASQYNVATPSTKPLETYEYDSFDRPTEVVGYDGSLRKRIDYAGLTQTAWDADDLDASNSHANTPTTVVRDGHGRTISATQINEGNQFVTQWAYQATGEVTSLTRTGGYVHTASYDSLGRMVTNYEPNSQGLRLVDGFPLRTGWIYAYDDAGRLVATTDARGCGENIFYDAAGRTIAEDYSPCAAGQSIYTPADLSSGTGTEAFYKYDSNEAGDTTPSAAIGRLTSVSDRAAHTRAHYDQRGRVVDIQRQLGRPVVSQALAERYTPHWYETQASFDEGGDTISESTGADVPELLGPDGTSVVTASYSTRGFLKGASGSYGALVTSTRFDADGLPLRLVVGDSGSTTTTFSYDTLRRLAEQVVASTATTTHVPMAYEDTAFHYDPVGNPIEIDDLRTPSQWPQGAKPVSQKNIVYDDLYRLRSIQYDSGGDTFSPPSTGLSNALPDTAPVPTPPTSAPLRAQMQAFTYDALGNTQTSSDDANVFFDRSLGSNIQNGVGGSVPNQLTSASTSTGFVGAHYDAAGNVVDMTVQRTQGCTASTGECTHRLVYFWDEVNELAVAARWDFAGAYSATLPQYPALPDGQPAVAITMTYDSDGQRVLKGVLPSAQAAAGDVAYSAEIFPSLRLDDSSYENGDYVRDETTESAYLQIAGSSVARVVFDADGAMPAPTGNHQHVFFELSDHLGSASSIIDKETGDLVERSTFLAYGAADSDYRSDAWQYWEPYRFTGKQSDVELGLTYFGARYYSPNLGRWMSPDPVAVHSFGSDPNPYAYVSGQVTSMTDPLGLDDDGDDGPTHCYECGDLSQYAADNQLRWAIEDDIAAHPAKPYDTTETADDRAALAPSSANGVADTGGGGSGTGGWDEETTSKAPGAIAFGFLEGLVPGGFLAEHLRESTGNPTLERLRASGQIVGGIAAIYFGFSSVGLGGVGEFLSGGAATPVAVPAIVGGATLATSGAAAIGTGIYSMITGRASKGGSSSTARASSPPNDHHVFPQEFRKWFAARGVDIDKYLVDLPENVHLDQLHAQKIDTSAGPMRFGPGGIWNENWRQFINANPNATTQEILDYGRALCAGFGIAGCP